MTGMVSVFGRDGGVALTILLFSFITLYLIGRLVFCLLTTAIHMHALCTMHVLGLADSALHIFA
jgi:hypothetical protein